jgi:predicted phage terminase large subunit-like protein
MNDKPAHDEVLSIIQDGDSVSIVPVGTKGSQSRQFIPAKLADNPKLAEVDPDYESKLKDNDVVRRAQLLEGNWLVKPAAGLYYQRAWTPIVEVKPLKAQRVRYWDRAATVDGDWTVGVLMSRADTILVEDVVRLRGTPQTVIKTIKATAQLDGPTVTQVLEQDPGQAGVVEADVYSRELLGHAFRFVKPSGDKVTRFGPFSSQCEAGNVRLLKAPWNKSFIEELEEFPDGNHDDQCDASSGAFSCLANIGATLGARPTTPRRSMDGF